LVVAVHELIGAMTKWQVKEIEIRSLGFLLEK
jgi:hypothetical protein